MNPRVLIVGTVPYNTKSTSRAFDAYFSNWNRDCLAQIFSNTKIPIKGHCSSLFQITDQRLVKRFFSKKIITGIVFDYEDLPQEWENNDLEVKSSLFAYLYQRGQRKSSLNHLLRKMLWKEKFWHTKELDKWLDSFNPECVFLSFSDDFFIPQIAFYVANRFKIPIVSSIGDDYYFDFHFSLSPFYYIYKMAYRRLIRKVLGYPGSAIYIGDKIRDKYNEHFGLDGKTVFLSSSFHRKPFKPIDVNFPKIVYCGNVRLGRNKSLIDIAKVLYKINKNYRISVYSNETDSAYTKCLIKTKNIDYKGSVSYAEVENEMETSDIVIIVEGFLKKDVDVSRYSLSTKVADSLACGSFILTYGSEECGAIEYLKENACGLTCTSYHDLEENLPSIFVDSEYQHQKYNQSICIFKKNHCLEASRKIFCSVVESTIAKYKGKKC